MRRTPTILLSTLVLSLAAAGCKDGPRACDLAAPSCPAGSACLANADGSGGVCTASCDATDPGACGAAQVCDPVLGGGSACFDPVVFTGVVFDGATDAPIEGATVLAADDTGIVVTAVSVSDLAGSYTLAVPVLRDGSGAIVDGTYTLRVSASDYQPYPAGIRPAIPIDVSSATYDDATGRWVITNATTSVSLIALAGMGLPSISGKVGGDVPVGTLVVAECTSPPCPFAYAGLDGSYIIHNVPSGDYEVRAYRVDQQITPVMVNVSSTDLVDVDLAPNASPLATVSGPVNIVTAAGGSLPSVVLIPSSTFQQISPTFVRGEVAPGLRAPEPGIAPNVLNTYTISGIPEGTYKVLAAFENDLLIRDPDPGIAGTQILEITVPDPVDGLDITVGSNFKVTQALEIFSPGATAPEAIDPMSPPDLVFAQDSGEQSYDILVYDAFGNEVWSTNVLPPMGSTPVSVSIAGQFTLDPGMYYQFRAISLDGGGDPLATTEDLLGVFYVP